MTSANVTNTTAMNDWNLYLSSLQPASQLKYKRNVQSYLNFCSESNLMPENAGTVLRFLEKMHSDEDDTFCAKTLWSVCSQINAFIMKVYKKSPVFLDEPLIKTVLNNWSKREVVKKAKHFTKEDVYRFLEEADNSIYLVIKVVLIVAVNGLLRRGEISRLNFENVHLTDKDFRVTVQRQKQTGPPTPSTFLVTDPLMHNIIKEYYCTFGNDIEKSGKFLRRLKHGSKLATKNCVGESTIADFSKQIAEYLGKEDPKNYTCHSFRRTGATILANGNLSIETIKKAGGWNSSTVAATYFGDSDTMHQTVAHAFQKDGGPNNNLPHMLEESASIEKHINSMIQNLSMSFTNCASITINFYGNPPPAIASASDVVPSSFLPEDYSAIAAEEEEAISDAIFSHHIIEDVAADSSPPPPPAITDPFAEPLPPPLPPRKRLKTAKFMEYETTHYRKKSSD